MLSRESVDLEQRLAKLLGADAAAVRSYLYEVIEERLWAGARRSVRPASGSCGAPTAGVVRDPEGNDTPPVGYEASRVP